jgi:hypothetical protein
MEILIPESRGRHSNTSNQVQIQERLHPLGDVGSRLRSIDLVLGGKGVGQHRDGLGLRQQRPQKRSGSAKTEVAIPVDIQNDDTVVQPFRDLPRPPDKLLRLRGNIRIPHG